MSNQADMVSYVCRENAARCSVFSMCSHSSETAGLESAARRETTEERRFRKFKDAMRAEPDQVITSARDYHCGS